MPITVGDRIAQERRLKAARDCTDVDQRTVAEAVGVSAPTVSKWESGEATPRDGVLVELARYFGVTPAWLRYGQMPREAPPEHRPVRVMLPETKAAPRGKGKARKRSGGA